MMVRHPGCLSVAVKLARIVGCAHLPAVLGPRRRGLLRAAARAAGLGPVGLVAEPVAAAYFVSALDTPVPAGSVIVGYDLGAGTFDATVVRRTHDGFDVLAGRTHRAGRSRCGTTSPDRCWTRAPAR